MTQHLRIHDVIFGATTQETTASQTRNKGKLCKEILSRTSASETDV
jgi:hypothetical protein